MTTQTPAPGGQYKKAQPVVVLGAVIASLTALLSGLQILFKDNPTIVLVLGVVGVVVTALTVFKDQFLKSQVVPVQDTAQYIDQTGALVAGPASPLPDGTPIEGSGFGQADVNPDGSYKYPNGDGGSTGSSSGPSLGFSGGPVVRFDSGGELKAGIGYTRNDGAPEPLVGLHSLSGE